LTRGAAGESVRGTEEGSTVIEVVEYGAAATEDADRRQSTVGG
jgi:hypothetical protein